jgi:hypothetical protein
LEKNLFGSALCKQDLYYTILKGISRISVPNPTYQYHLQYSGRVISKLEKQTNFLESYIPFFEKYMWDLELSFG